MKSINFNPLERVNPLFENAKPLTQTRAERVLSASLPIMQMFGATKPFATVISGAYSVIPFGKQLAGNYLAQDKKALAINMLQAAFVTATVAGSILMPTPAAIAGFAYQFGNDLATLVKHVNEKKYDAAAADLFKIVNQAIYVGAAVLGGPELLFLALVLQAGKELYQAKNEFAEERYIEMAAHILTAVLRLYAAHPHLVAMNRDWFGKQLSQDDLKPLFIQAVKVAASQPEQKVDFDKMLAEKGFSSRIKNLEFKEKINQILFKNMSFQDCTFNTTVSNTEFLNSRFNFVSIKDSKFNDVTFQNCTFNTVEFYRSTLTSFKFVNSSFENGAFRFSNFIKGQWSHSKLSDQIADNSVFKNVTFDNTRWIKSNIGASNLNEVVFDHSELEDVIFGKNQNSKLSQLEDVQFVDSKVKKVAFSDVDLNNLKFEGSEISVTKFNKISNLIFA